MYVFFLLNIYLVMIANLAKTKKITNIALHFTSILHSFPYCLFFVELKHFLAKQIIDVNNFTMQKKKPPFRKNDRIVIC